jgi:hypothetical protein
MKILGYILCALGLVGIVIPSFKPLTTLLEKTPLAAMLASKYFTIVSVILVVVGVAILIINSKSTKQPKEVPIYDKEGKTIVGYRRMTDKK